LDPVRRLVVLDLVDFLAVLDPVTRFGLDLDLVDLDFDLTFPDRLEVFEVRFFGLADFEREVVLLTVLDVDVFDLDDLDPKLFFWCLHILAANFMISG
jgi:hypothetical protein